MRWIVLCAIMFVNCHFCFASFSGIRQPRLKVLSIKIEISSKLVCIWIWLANLVASLNKSQKCQKYRGFSGSVLVGEVIILVTAFTAASFWAWRSSFLLCVSSGHPNEHSSMGNCLAETKLILCLALSVFSYHLFFIHIYRSAPLTLFDMFLYPASRLHTLICLCHSSFSANHLQIKVIVFYQFLAQTISPLTLSSIHLNLYTCMS